MIISRTPFRVSFFGGGTDYPVWFRERGGAVLGTAIDKYCYIHIRKLPPFFAHRYRIVYSRIEETRSIDDIQHAVVREVLRMHEIDEGVEIHHDGDMPARAGLGSSSSFTVGMLHAVEAFKGIRSTRAQLGRRAIHTEQCVLRENVGVQDQLLAAHGGFCHLRLGPGDAMEVRPVTIGEERRRELADHLLLFFTGVTRVASHIARHQIECTPARESELRAMHQMVDEALALLHGGRDLRAFGELLHESWLVKRSLTEHISTPMIDDIYGAARAAGAVGGKLLGAGGGGFMLFLAPPEAHAAIRETLHGLVHVPFGFDDGGSRIIVYQPESSLEIQPLELPAGGALSS